MKIANYIIAGILLFLIGGGGLYFILTNLLPTLGPRWLFFFLLTLAIGGIALPVSAFLNRRFPSKPPAEGKVIVRQAIIVGLYADILVWLQLGRVLNGVLAFFIGSGFTLIEILIRLRERSRWEPKGLDE